MAKVKTEPSAIQKNKGKVKKSSKPKYSKSEEQAVVAQTVAAATDKSLVDLGVYFVQRNIPEQAALRAAIRAISKSNHLYRATLEEWDNLLLSNGYSSLLTAKQE